MPIGENSAKPAAKFPVIICSSVQPESVILPFSNFVCQPESRSSTLLSFSFQKMCLFFATPKVHDPSLSTVIPAPEWRGCAPRTAPPSWSVAVATQLLELGSFPRAHRSLRHDEHVEAHGFPVFQMPYQTSFYQHEWHFL